MSKKKKILICCVIIFSFVFCVSLNASSYTFKPWKIKTSNPIMFIVQKEFGTTSFNHMNDALYKWNSASGYTLMRRDPNSRHTDGVYPHKDGISCVYRINAGAGAGYVAQASTQSNLLTKNVTESDINFNMHYSWANSAKAGSYDVWSIFQHESGHTAGLGHSANTSAVMYKYCSSNSISWRTLKADDRNGINAKY
ncbi:MAG: matrixin family metalloprotease [Bacillota bacterium]|jgi:hypothetical protein